ncbi:reverse transcriptase [Phytophthora megakarya]|uniref:Reverse transcriptase n=1 Tax=Phytophthora megakarya TaxID=4795 RepID=A0A225WE08_9STRA|nr:reverse transcriptase [Phytophthora megakarya]
MTDVFLAFNCIVGPRQIPTMAYRPQANDADPSREDVCRQREPKGLERVCRAPDVSLNTAQDRVRGDTPFFLVHGWDPRSTLEASLPVVSTHRRYRNPRRWRNHVQSHYQRAREVVNERLCEAIRDRADHHNEGLRPYNFKAGGQVWLYLDRVKVDYARKLAHL